MLADDELDFEYDLAELEDLGDYDDSGLTTEELEKQLGIDLDIDLEPISEDSFSKVAPTKEEPKSEPQEIKSDSKAKVIAKEDKKAEDKKTEDKKTEDKKTEDKKAEDKKTIQVKKDVLDNAAKQAASPKVPDQEEKKQDQPKKFDKKPIPSSLDNQHNSYKNRAFNNNNSMNYYAMQQAMFYPQMQASIMTMNGMFPYPQQQNFNTPNRIYVNPNFKGRPHLPTMGNQSQQQPKETQHADGAKQNMSAQEELLAKQRREAAESLRRRLANKQQEGGMKRKNTDGPINEAKRLHTDASNNNQKRDHSNFNESKRLATQPNHASPIPSNRGFSIRGAAAKASQQGRMKEEERKPKLSVQDRLSNVRKQEVAIPKAPSKPPITARLQRREQASPMSKKVENGKSSELVISNLNENTTFNDIKKLIDESNTVAKITYTKGESTSTLLFGSIDAAVAFRRKYNRSKVGDSHVTIAFKK